jgi:hypothetical protein
LIKVTRTCSGYRLIKSLENRLNPLLYLGDIVALSIKPIHICLENDILKQMDSFSLQQYTNKSLVPLLGDVPDTCKCGSKYNLTPVLVASHHKKQHEHMLYSDLGVAPVKVHMVQCANKEKECNIHYQGNADGIFNFSGNILLTYSVLFDFLFSLVCAKGTTYSGFAQKLEIKYKYFAHQGGSWNLTKFLPKSTWIQCWSAFQKVLTVKQLRQACEICKYYPRVLCFDGVSLGFPKKFVNWNTVDLIPNKSDPITIPQNTTDKIDRMIVKKVAVRTLLLDFLEDRATATSFDRLLDGLLKEKSEVHGLLKVS